MLDWFRINTARFFDEKGESIGSTNFSKDKSKFRYKEKTFVNDSNNKNYYEESAYLFLTRRTYLYNIKNPFPLSLARQVNNKNIDSEQLDIILESNVAKKLNEIAMSSIPEWLNMKNVIIGLIVVGIAYYVFTKGVT